MRSSRLGVCHRAGADAVAAHAARHVVRRHRFRQADDRRLAGAVERAVRHALHAARDRGDVDDRAVAARQHARQEGAHRAEHGTHVEVEGERPFVFGGVEDAALVDEAGAVATGCRSARRRRRRGRCRRRAARRASRCGSARRRCRAAWPRSTSVAITAAPSAASARRDGATDPLPGGGDEGGLAGERGAHGDGTCPVPARALPAPARFRKGRGACVHVRARGRPGVPCAPTSRSALRAGTGRRRVYPLLVVPRAASTGPKPHEDARWTTCSPSS